MESPGKSLGITVVSPTPVVLDHPTPYFAPSGEQAQVPLNQNTTPEHVSETEKVNRCCLFRYLQIFLFYFYLIFSIPIVGKKTTNQKQENQDIRQQ